MNHADVLALENHWETDPRWAGVERTYSAEDVVRLRGSLQEEQTLARRGAERLWAMLEDQSFVRALGAMTGGQAVQMVKAGLQAIYLSGWQVAADANLSGPEPVPGQLRAGGRTSDQQRLRSRRPDRSRPRRPLARLLRSHRC